MHSEWMRVGGRAWGKWFTNVRKSKKTLPGSPVLRMLPEITQAESAPRSTALWDCVVSRPGTQPLPWACLICHLKTANMAPHICTILLVINVFVIMAAACLIITNGCTHVKWHAIGKSLPPAETIHEDATKMLSKQATLFKGNKLLHLGPHSDGEISPTKFSPRTPVWTASGFQAVGTSVLFVSCHFWKLDDRGRAPLCRPPTEAVIYHAHY